MGVLVRQLKLTHSSIVILECVNFTMELVIIVICKDSVIVIM